MTDTAKCEPPEELRGVVGWHWVQLPFVAVPTPIAWMCNPDNQEREWRMPSSPAFVSGESKTARTWRYISPALTPAEAAALRAERDAAVAEVARLREALDFYACADHYPVHGAEAPAVVRADAGKRARAALNPEPAP